MLLAIRSRWLWRFQFSLVPPMAHHRRKARPVAETITLDFPEPFCHDRRHEKRLFWRRILSKHAEGQKAISYQFKTIAKLGLVDSSPYDTVLFILPIEAVNFDSSEKCITIPAAVSNVSEHRRQNEKDFGFASGLRPPALRQRLHRSHVGGSCAGPGTEASIGRHRRQYAYGSRASQRSQPSQRGAL